MVEPQRALPTPRLEIRLAAARKAQEKWARLPIRQRLVPVRRLRHAIAESARELSTTVGLPQRSGPAETLAAEILPLAEACRFLEREAAGVLRSRRLGRSGRPGWLSGLASEVRREPWGVVLVIGPSNYPLLLAAVQSLQALVAGNAVLWKPGTGGHTCAAAIETLTVEAGFPPELLTILPEDVEWALASIEAGVDKVLLTGSAATGRSVLRRLSETVTPATLELSGSDAVFVQSAADLDLVANAVTFGLTWNGGATCIAPRRVFVPRASAVELEARLRHRLDGLPPVPLPPEEIAHLASCVAEAVAAGARVAGGAEPRGGSAWPLVLADVTPAMRIARDSFMAPVACLIGVRDDEEALVLDHLCSYALGAVVFGAEKAAIELAGRINAGVVVVNDMIVPTADPRIPFGGRGASGYGSTRGREGLLELTRPKAVVLRRGRRRPHFAPRRGGEARLFSALLRALHCRSPIARLRGAWDGFQSLRAMARDDSPDRSKGPSHEHFS